MGNIHAMARRMKALAIACLASAALSFGVLAGFQCNFLKIQARSDRTIAGVDGVEYFLEGDNYNGTLTTLTAVAELSIGVLCDHDDTPMFQDDDRMWQMARVFFWAGNVGLGALATLVAWALGTCVPPSTATWRALAIVSAATAVFQVPVFILFESEPCVQDINRQTCTLDVGSYFNIASIIFWVALTLTSQCMDPPKWQDELRAWVIKTDGKKPGNDDDEDDDLDTDESFDRSIPCEIRTSPNSSADRSLDVKNRFVGDTDRRDKRTDADDVELQVRGRSNTVSQVGRQRQSEAHESRPTSPLPAVRRVPTPPMPEQHPFYHRSLTSTAAPVSTLLATDQPSSANGSSRLFSQSYALTEDTPASLDTWEDFAKNQVHGDPALLARRDDTISELDSHRGAVGTTEHSKRQNGYCDQDSTIRKGAAAVMDALRPDTVYRAPRSKKSEPEPEGPKQAPGTDLVCLPTCSNDTLNDSIIPSLLHATAELRGQSATEDCGQPVSMVHVPTADVVRSHASEPEQPQSPKIQHKRSARSEDVRPSLIRETRRKRDVSEDESRVMSAESILQDLESPMYIRRPNR